MKRYLSALLLFFIFLAVYYAGSFTKIPFADCLGFVLDVEKGKWIGTSAATTHFLYVNTAIALKNLTGLNSIEANRLLVMFSGAATVSVIYAAVKIITKTEWASVTAAIVFGLSFTFWRNAEIVEVYTFNCLWLSLFFLSIIKTFVENNKKYILLSGLFLGISLWLHIQNILLIPAFLVFLFHFRHEKKQVYSSLLIFGLLFSSLFILNTMQGLPLRSVYSSEHGTWVEDSFKKTFMQYVMDLIKSLAYLIYNFNLFAFFGVIGTVLLYKTNRKMFFVFFTGAVCVYGFSTFYAVSDNYVFFLPFNIIFALSIGYGLSAPKYTVVKKFSWVCLLIPLGYLVIYKAAFSTEKGRAFHLSKKHKGGLNYFILPWMNNNPGILEFTIDDKTAQEPVQWMKTIAREYIELMKTKGYTEEELRQL